MSTARLLTGSNLATNTVFGPSPVQGRRLSVQASWTGTPTGTFALESTFDGTNWYVVPGAAAEFTANGNAQPAGGAGSAIWIWDNVPGTMVRLRYTATSGTGTAALRASYGD